MKHRHLDYPPGTPVEERPVAALVDAIERGDLSDWRPIAATIARAPHGPFASRIMDLAAAYPTYGASPLWRAWIERRRAAVETAAPEAPVSLAELRRQMGLTQVEMARRVGISQSDLSKLERRADVRVSTLNAYAEAVGGRLRLLVVAGSRLAEIRMGPANARRRKARRR